MTNLDNPESTLGETQLETGDIGTPGGLGNKGTMMKVGAVAVIVLLLLAAVMFTPQPTVTASTYNPTIDLPDNYLVMVDEPIEEADFAFVASLGSIVNHNGYHPFYILGPDGMDVKQLWTLQHMNFNEFPVLLFTNDSDGMLGKLNAQGIAVLEEHIFEISNTVLGDFKGFDNAISVASYREALWVAPLAKATNKVVVLGQTTYATQEDVWEEQLALGMLPNYIVVTNPYDWDESRLDSNFTQFHVPSLSAVAAELAGFRDAFVLTDWNPSTEPPYDAYMDNDFNAVQIGLLNKLIEMNATIGAIEYIGIVGSAVAVPQFTLPDETSTNEGSFEPDGVNSDAMYGFLADRYVMSAAVGRIINLNVQGVCDQLIRTFMPEAFQDTLEIDYGTEGGGVQNIEWRKHGSVWNGFEVADERRQMTPGRYMTQDLEDEGLSYDYMRTTGNEGFREATTGKVMSIQPIMESSTYVFYRGHGSWHATFYVYVPDDPFSDPQGKGRLEGNHPDMPGSPNVFDYNLPPQVGVLISCENAKIWGEHFGGEDIVLEQTFALNYLYAGAVGLIAATEVSFSNIGQDVHNKAAMVENFLTEGDAFAYFPWDMNNQWYAFPSDGMLNHEEEHGTIGKAHQWAENRYIATHGSEYSPFDQGTTAHWKETAMFTCLGDPAYLPIATNPGANDFDPWHTGPEDH